jgi:hypothetical protein
LVTCGGIGLLRQVGPSTRRRVAHVVGRGVEVALERELDR